MAIQCSSCGIETERTESFIKTRRSFRRREVYYCPACWSRQQVKAHSFVLWLNLGYGLAGAVFAWFWPEKGTGWFLLHLFLFQLFAIATILPHELGHAFVARWAGFRTFKIVVGMGRPVWKGKLFQFETELGLVPAGGFAFMAPRQVEGYRRKLFAIVSAGPAVNLLLLIAILPAVDPASLWNFSTLEEGFAPAVMFFYANLWVLAANLLPYSFTHPLGRFPTDGKQILCLPFMKPEAAAQAHASYFAAEAAEHHNQGNFQEAFQWFERGLALYPKDPALLVGRGLQLLDSGEFHAARDTFHRLLDQSSLHPAFRPVLMNNIAEANIMAGDPSLLEEADHFSKEAIAALGNMPQVKGTRGAVLVELGRWDEAIPLLQQAMQENETAANKAENACWIAIAEARRGNRTQAENYLEQARQLWPSAPCLPRAERVTASSGNTCAPRKS
jgi:tetratricopeptide (TPR) repeat protein